MPDRRPIQQVHERTFIRQFLEWFNIAYRCKFEIIAEPNPPEAIIRTKRTTRWVEVSTAFWNEAYARDLYSYATPGEIHKPIDSGPYINIDKQFTTSFVSVLKKKLEKASYENYRDRYGPGYLIIPIKHPWFDGATADMMKKSLASVQGN